MRIHSSDVKIFKIRELQSVLVLVLSLATALKASASPQRTEFSFLDFSDGRLDGQGDISISRDSIQLTRATLGQHTSQSVGRVTYREPMRLWDKETRNMADFSTQFTFIIDSQDYGGSGDGLTFFLVPVGSQLPANSSGHRLGLVSPNRDPSNSSTTSFVAVEFDSYVNNNTDVMDPNCSRFAHVGIDLNNLTSKFHRCVDWFEAKIRSGGRINATITYNSSAQNLSLVMVDAVATGANLNSSVISGIVDMRNYLPEWVTLGFSAATGSDSELHTIKAWNFSSAVQVAEKKSKLWLWLTLGSVSSILLILVLALVWFRHHSKRNRTDMSGEEDDLAIEEEFDEVLGPRKISYKDLVAATNNFAVERLLGVGGFGKVYEGYLNNVKANVAIKKISPGSRQGIKEYATEVKTISRLRHRNLVQLIGWCHERKELLLVYEFMFNRSLDSHLFKERSFLPWDRRYQIAQGVASALLYLHEEWEQCVVHRDIKSSNVMLDADFTAKLGDFGLARLVDHAKGLQTTMPAGTMGYIAPEYIHTGKPSKESDVYSFGVVLLEIACGRKVIEPRADQGRVHLVDWVWELYGTGRLMDAADSKLGADFVEKQLECLMVVGLWCAHPDHAARPSIREGLNAVNFNTPLPVLPSHLPVPTYLAPLSRFSVASIVSSHDTGTSSPETSACTTSSAQSSRAFSALLPNAG